MPRCKNCKKDGKGRELVELPDAQGIDPSTKKPYFKKKGAALVCPHCDGETLIDTSIRNHQAREQDQA